MPKHDPVKKLKCLPPMDTTAGIKAVLAAVGVDIVPPAHIKMEDGDLPFFESIIGECAAYEWTAHRIELACHLARAMSDLEHEQQMVREEGSVIENKRGTNVANPRRTMLATLGHTVMNLRRALHIHGPVGVSPNTKLSDLGRKRGSAKAIEEQLTGFEDDGLLG